MTLTTLPPLQPQRRVMQISRHLQMTILLCENQKHRVVNHRDQRVIASRFVERVLVIFSSGVDPRHLQGEGVAHGALFDEGTRSLSRRMSRGCANARSAVWTTRRACNLLADRRGKRDAPTRVRSMGHTDNPWPLRSSRQPLCPCRDEPGGPTSPSNINKCASTLVPRVNLENEAVAVKRKAVISHLIAGLRSTDETNS